MSEIKQSADSEMHELGTCAGFCECYKVPHRKQLCTGDKWQPSKVEPAASSAEPSEEMRLLAVKFAKAYPDLTLGQMLILARFGTLIRQQTAARCAEMPLTIPPKHPEERGTAAHLRDQIRAEFEVGKVATNAD